ncbi:unnamed protein product [Urochloa humidicola]
MELTKLLFPLVFLLLTRLSEVSFVGSVPVPRTITSMFTFGDSYIDTGNFVIVATTTPIVRYYIPVWIDKLPYGMTFFGRPTGRTSDGRVIIDFIADKLGLLFLPASLSNTSDVSRGVNFAVGGATAIEVRFYENRLTFPLPYNSLDVQLDWFEALRPSLCNTTGAAGSDNCFGKSLFMVGEFGFYDYTLEYVRLSASRVEPKKIEGYLRTSFVPTVVNRIALAVERLINGGAMWCRGTRRSGACRPSSASTTTPPTRLISTTAPAASATSTTWSLRLPASARKSSKHIRFHLLSFSYPALAFRPGNTFAFIQESFIYQQKKNKARKRYEPATTDMICRNK